MKEELRSAEEMNQKISEHLKERDELFSTLKKLCEIYEKNSPSKPVRQTINIVSSMISYRDTWIEALNWALRHDEQQVKSKIHIILDLMEGLEKKLGSPIPTEEVIASAEEFGIECHDTQNILQKLKESGSIFEPKKNFVERIK